LVEEAGRKGRRTGGEVEGAEEAAALDAIIEDMLEGMKRADTRRENGTRTDNDAFETEGAAPPPFAGTSTAHAARRTSTPWTCDICTLQNPAAYLVCDACGVERVEDPAAASPPPPPARPVAPSLARPDRPLGWACRACGTHVAAEWWTCTTCGLMKLAG
jgi:hypothetical protein